MLRRLFTGEWHCDRVEDSSDLMPIFLRQNATLVDAYSTYFLAEIVEAQDENLKCLVAEVHSRFSDDARPARVGQCLQYKLYSDYCYISSLFRDTVHIDAHSISNTKRSRIIMKIMKKKNVSLLL